MLSSRRKKETAFRNVVSFIDPSFRRDDICVQFLSIADLWLGNKIDNERIKHLTTEHYESNYSKQNFQIYLAKTIF